jgi:hypothetical protein
MTSDEILSFDGANYEKKRSSKRSYPIKGLKVYERI